MRYTVHCDRWGEPLPPLRPLTRREAHRRHYARVEAARHADADVRADVLVRIDDEIDARAMFRVDAHVAAGLTPGALDDQSLTTERLRAALEALRALPRP